MESIYWIAEYGKVLFAYLFLMFLWPSEVFRKVLRGRKLSFCIAFCATIQVLLYNAVVLMAGLCHVLNPWLINVLFYGTFIYAYFKNRGTFLSLIKIIKNIIVGNCKMKQALLILFRYLRCRIQIIRKVVQDTFRGRILECILVVGMLLYGMIYLTYGEIQINSYGFGDMYVHHSWVNYMKDGKIFMSGIYPAAMHCFLYMVTTVFGIRLSSAVLYLGPVHVMLLLLAVYFFLKNLFKGKYTPIMALALFLMFRHMCENEVYGMSRLQWTLPQEFGFFSMYFCALFLWKYLQKEKCGTISIPFLKKRKLEINENLFLFMTSLSASFVIHFYDTIIAFFLCFSIAIFYIIRIFREKFFLPLCISVVTGVLIAALPMAIAFASGYQFEGSINWAMSVMEENHDDTSVQNTEQTAVTTEGEEDTQSPTGSAIQNEGGIKPKTRKIVQKPLSVRVQTFARKAYDNSYRTLYNEYGKQVFLASVVDAILAVLCMIASLVIKFINYKRGKKKAQRRNGYLSILLASGMYLFLYATPDIGLPELIAGARLCSTINILVAAIMIIPFDIIMGSIEQISDKKLYEIGNMVCMVAIVSFIVVTDNYHGYLYCEFTRYNETVDAAEQIIKNCPKYEYTLVSPVDELYQVIRDGRHYELYDFITDQTKKKQLYIPTPYVFVLLEKRPIKYAQRHFFRGPDWLAKGNYAKMIGKELASVHPKYIAGEISEKNAKKEFKSGVGRWVYDLEEDRNVLESKAYQWCQKFRKLYPNEMKVYYEDDKVVCYYFKQNSNRLYDLNFGNLK